MIANDGKRLYSLRGIVRSYRVHRTGWWIFKKKELAVSVQLRDDQLRVLNKVIKNQNKTYNTSLAPVTPTVEIIIDDEDQKDFPMGAEVGVCIAYYTPQKRGLFTVTSLEVEDVKVMHPGVVLPAEIINY